MSRIRISILSQSVFQHLKGHAKHHLYFFQLLHCQSLGTDQPNEDNDNDEPGDALVHLHLSIVHLGHEKANGSLFVGGEGRVNDCEGPEVEWGLHHDTLRI